MQEALFDPDTPQTTARLSVNSDLLRQAIELQVNVAQALEAGLIEAVRRKRQGGWVSANRGALEAYNAHVERDGVFSDGLRSF